MMPERLPKKNQRRDPLSLSLCKSDLDHIYGLILLKDLYLQQKEGKYDLNVIIRQPILVPEYTSAYKVLEKFRQERIHYAIVIDEYGATAGFVTMDDLLDALLGILQKCTMKNTGSKNWMIMFGKLTDNTAFLNFVNTLTFMKKKIWRVILIR